MITGKVDGHEFKMTVNEEETYWNEIVETTKKQIKDMEKMLKFQKAVLVMAKKKMKESTR